MYKKTCPFDKTECREDCALITKQNSCAIFYFLDMAGDKAKFDLEENGLKFTHSEVSNTGKKRTIGDMLKELADNDL